MRFLVDECVGPAVADFLQNAGHEVFSVYDHARGMNDNDIIGKAWNEHWILITSDKDFGDKIFREQRKHHGVVLLRLADERSTAKIKTIERLLKSHSDKLSEQFVVVTETNVRFAQK